MNRKNRNDMKIKTFLLFAITLLIWALLFFVKLHFWGAEGESVIDDIVSNMVGIIPPLLIFDFGLEYLTRDNIASDISEKITQTLMGESEAISAFKDDDKIRFVKNTVKHLVGEDAYDMVYAVMEPYITGKYNRRSMFRYKITLKNGQKSDLFDDRDYFRIYESLRYRKNYSGDCTLPQKFSVAFIMNDNALDEALRNRTYIFQENLLINPAELKKLLEMPTAEKRDFIEKELHLSVYVDGKLCTLEDADFGENIILANYVSEHDPAAKVHDIDLNFSMPQKRGVNDLMISISEPTYSPVIELSYPETDMEVKAFSFLNDGEDSSLDSATHNIDSFEFNIQDKWIYPMSGVVFAINTTREE